MTSAGGFRAFSPFAPGPVGDGESSYGVGTGLADRLGIDPVIVRAGLILLSLLGGAGITIYLVAWALLPNDRDEIVAQRALRDGDGGSIVVVIFATVGLFGGSAFGGRWWSGHSGWGFPWGVALTGLLIWWLVKRSGNAAGAWPPAEWLAASAAFVALRDSLRRSPSPVRAIHLRPL